jgi:hypothetical protein
MSTEGKVERVLLIGTSNLSRIIGKNLAGEGEASQGAGISAGLGYGSGSDQWCGLCYS